MREVIIQIFDLNDDGTGLIETFTVTEGEKHSIIQHWDIRTNEGVYPMKTVGEIDGRQLATQALQAIQGNQQLRASVLEQNDEMAA